MVSKQLAVWGLTGLWLGAAGCGGKRASDAAENQDAGRPPDGADAAVTANTSESSEEVQGTTSGGELSDPEPDLTIDVETSSPLGGDAGVSTDAANTDVPSTAELAIEQVSFAADECAAGNWCWVAGAPVGERFHAVSGTANGSTVFAVGPQGACAQYETATDTWTLHTTPTRGDLHGVLVVSDNEVWVAGADGLDFYDGSKWERQLVGWVRTVARGSDGELWATSDEQLYKREGGAWRLVVPTIDGAPVFPQGGGALEVLAGDEGELWIMTFQSRSRPYRDIEVVRLQQGTWSKLDGKYLESYTPKLARYNGGLFFADSFDWYDINQGWQKVDPLPEHWTTVEDRTITITGTALTELTDEPSAPRVIDVPATTALWAARSDSLWLALGAGGLMRADYTTGEVSEPSVQNDSPWHTTTGIEWAASETDVWRGPYLEHFDGTAWAEVTMAGSAPYVERISGSGPADVWFVTYTSAAPLRWDGSLLQEAVAPNPDGTVINVHAFDADNVWVGERQESKVALHRFEGSGWSEVKAWTFDTTVAGTALMDISGPSASDAYVALSDHVEHFDGEQWETLFVAPEGEVFTAIAADTERVWVLGENYVYHRDANGDWQQQWYGFQSMRWIGLTEDAVWIMGGTSSSSTLRLTE